MDDVAQEIARESMKADRENATKTEDIVKRYLRAGVNPRYLAQRYGVDLERCQRYADALTQQKERRREHEQSMRGNRESPEIRPISHGSGGSEKVGVS